MNLTLIAAIGKNNELGKDNELLWHFKDDMKFFRENTIGKPVVMGRKTLESLPKVLPKRLNVVLTHQYISVPCVVNIHSKKELYDLAKNYPEVMIIGGSSLYKEFLKDAKRMLLTEIDDSKEADVYFPKFDKSEWDSRILGEHVEEGISFKHKEYIRKRN